MPPALIMVAVIANKNDKTNAEEIWRAQDYHKGTCFLFTHGSSIPRSVAFTIVQCSMKLI